MCEGLELIPENKQKQKITLVGKQPNTRKARGNGACILIASRVMLFTVSRDNTKISSETHDKSNKLYSPIPQILEGEDQHEKKKYIY